MKRPLDKIRIAGFKSIRHQTVELGGLNVLIGANGAGKSNFIGVFRLLHELVNERLQVSVATAGGASQLLFQGPKVTDELELSLWFGQNGYSCSLLATSADAVVFKNEEVSFQGSGYTEPFQRLLGVGHGETKLLEASRTQPKRAIEDHVLEAFRSWKVYHFHDTGAQARVKQKAQIDDNRFLRPDAGNLAPFLYLLSKKEPSHYRRIVETIRMVAPFFEDFDLQPDQHNDSVMQLQWKERGTDSYFGPHSLSDGTLRFMALATLFLQPELPTTILLDEPELGLHPHAITLLVELMRLAATQTQVVVSTQSATLVDQLALDELIVVEREQGETVFKRLEEGPLTAWLEDYSLGELWQKNVVGGGPGF